MPIDIPPAPTQSIDALRSAFPSLINRPALTKIAPRLAAALANPSAATSLTPILSYRVYTLGLSALASGESNGLRAAKPAGWRHTISSNGEVITVDVSSDQSGSNHKFAALSSNPSAAQVQDEIQALNRDRGIAHASYEFSLLQIPAMGVKTIWLHDPSGKSSDILIPVAPVRRELVAGRKYQIAEFINALRDSAARILSADSPGKGSA
jgi:hypothetical protein